MSYGMIHGMFKAFDLLKTGKAMIGYASRNFVDEKSWMVEDNLVTLKKHAALKLVKSDPSLVFPDHECKI